MPEQSAPLDPQAIDLHAHFLPPRYRQSALAHGQAHPDGMPALPEWNVTDAIAMMDDIGIRAAVLSISAPGVGFLESAEDRADLARGVNEDGAAAVAEFPGRFGLLATLPLPDIDLSLREIEYAFETLHADGIALHTHYDDVYLGDEQLEPAMAALHARGALVTIHPVSPCGWEAVAFGRPRPIVEFLFDTTRAVVNLALSGVLDRYPGIRWVVPHAGAALPVLADRVNLLFSALSPPGSPPVDVVAALRRLHYDVAGVPLPRALPALLSLVDSDRLVYGSDYPFTNAAIVDRLARALVESPALDDALRRAVFSGTAERLIPRLAAAAGR